MKTSIVFVALSLLLYGCGNDPKQKQAEAGSDTTVDSFYVTENPNDGLMRGLSASVDGKTISIIDTTEHLYLVIDSVLDYDQDNDLDALMIYSESGGGNCCPDAYFLVTNNGNGTFTRSAMTEPSYHSPTLEKWKGQNTLLVRTNDAGPDGDDYKETIIRYAVEKGQLKVIEKLETKEIPAIKEIKASGFESVEDVNDLLFDLDGDNIADTIRCSIWERWNLLVPDFLFSDGSVYDKNGMSAKRIGILSSKTNGRNDLVLDLNRVYKWDGKAYKDGEEE